MKAKLKAILASTLGRPVAEIGDDLSMENVREWDSMAHLNLVLSIEATFSVNLDPEEFLRMTSLPAIESVLAQHGIQ